MDTHIATNSAGALAGQTIIVQQTVAIARIVETNSTERELVGSRVHDNDDDHSPSFTLAASGFAGIDTALL